MGKVRIYGCVCAVGVELTPVVFGIHDPRNCVECELHSADASMSDYLVCCKCYFLVDRKTGTQRTDNKWRY